MTNETRAEGRQKEEARRLRQTAAQRPICRPMDKGRVNAIAAKANKAGLKGPSTFAPLAWETPDPVPSAAPPS